MEQEKDEKIRALLRFVRTNEPGTDDFASRLSAVVEKLKENEKFRQEYAAMNLHDQDLIRETRKEALQQKAIETAENFLRMNVGTPEQISQGTSLPLEQVLELQKQLSTDTEKATATQTNS